MKAIAAVCASGAASVGGVTAGRVHRQRRDVENEEIQMYLSKLKELVPFMPKNRRLSKLEVIQYVIDYICDLQYALETHPSVATAVGSVATAVTTTTTTTSAAPVQRLTNSAATVNSAVLSTRQPLGVLAPNTIVPNTSCATQEQISTVSPDQLAHNFLYFVLSSLNVINFESFRFKFCLF
jgi:DNA-binding protein inhibitor ID